MEKSIPRFSGFCGGAEYFGLKKICYMLHPNDTLVMDKLRHLNEIVCDIGKWKFRRCDTEPRSVCNDGGAPQLVLAVRMYGDGKSFSVTTEAGTVSQLSVTYPNITAAIDDGMLGHMKHDGITPDQYGTIYAVLKRENARLKL